MSAALAAHATPPLPPAADGSGYEFMGDSVLQVDKINRQVGKAGGRCHLCGDDASLCTRWGAGTDAPAPPLGPAGPADWCRLPAPPASV